MAAPIISEEGRGLSRKKTKHRMSEPGALVIEHAEPSDAGQSQTQTFFLFFFIHMKNAGKTKAGLTESWTQLKHDSYISRTSLCQVCIPAWRGTWRGRTPGVSLCSWTLWDGGQVGGAGGVESMAESSPGWGTCPALQPLWWFWPRCLLSAFVSLTFKP